MKLACGQRPPALCCVLLHLRALIPDKPLCLQQCQGCECPGREFGLQGKTVSCKRLCANDSAAVYAMTCLALLMTVACMHQHVSTHCWE